MFIKLFLFFMLGFSQLIWPVNHQEKLKERNIAEKLAKLESHAVKHIASILPSAQEQCRHKPTAQWIMWDERFTCEQKIYAALHLAAQKNCAAEGACSDPAKAHGFYTAGVHAHTLYFEPTYNFKHHGLEILKEVFERQPWEETKFENWSCSKTTLDEIMCRRKDKLSQPTTWEIDKETYPQYLVRKSNLEAEFHERMHRE